MDRPSLSPDLLAKITGYEAELDQLHPLWRKPAPFDKLPVKALHRVKWLLKKRERALRGCDVEVSIEVPDPRNPRRCFAISKEATDGGAVPTSTTNPASPLAAPAWQAPEASVLAFELRMPLERIESALARLPETYRSDDGAREWCRMIDAEIKAAASAPPAKPPSPVPVPRPSRGQHNGAEPADVTARTAALTKPN